MSGPILTTLKPKLPQVARGWPLLAVPDDDGVLLWPDPHASVRQMIEVILRTAPGEQLMRPRFGAGVAAMLHAPNDLATRARMQDAITAALKLYEPRIRAERIDVDPAPDPREVLVTISYRVILTGAAGTLQATVAVGAG
ncbi:MAG: GPW/gp25 family protein [Acetobacteraceae bacterium]|nr:GPW/gp25 family protein [Acetobacteraceae bacterium]